MGALIYAKQPTHLLALVYLLVDYGSIIVAHLLLHDSAHQLVSVQPHASVERALLGLTRWRDEVTDGALVAVSVLSGQFFVYYLLFNLVVRSSLCCHLILDSRNVVWVVQLVGLWKTETSWSHILNSG